MIGLLSRALCFVAIIAVGFLLRRAGFFKREDFTLLSRIVINITLPAAIINNLNGRELEPSLLILVLVGFLYGVVLMIVGYMLNRREVMRRIDAAKAAAIPITNYGMVLGAVNGMAVSPGSPFVVGL